MALLLVTGCIGSALAGEMYLGTIYVVDGGTANNANTTKVDAGFTADGGASSDRYVAGGFAIPAQSKITLQEQTRTALVGANVATCDAGRCLLLSIAQIFPSSTGPAVNVGVSTTSPVLLSDAGLSITTSTYRGGVVSVAPVGGACCVAVDVYSRSGTE